MSSQPTGDTQGSAVSASQAGEGGAPEPTAAPAGVADPPGVALPAGARVPAQAAATAGTARGDVGAATGPAGAAGASAEAAETGAATATATGTEPGIEPDTGHSAQPGTEPDTGHGAGSGRREPVSKLAVVALITGLLALVPIAVACAIAALIGIRRTGRRGHGMAIAALFASATWLIMGSAVGTVAALTHGFEAEVFATFTLPASAWPGTAALRRDASSGCASRLTGYINPQLAISLAQSYVFPNKVAWTAGTRTVICEVRAARGQLTGSVRNASSLTGSAAALAAAGRAGVALSGLRVVHLAVCAAP